MNVNSTYKQGYALSIGVGADLPVTEVDAQAMAELLMSPQHCAYPKDNVRLLTGKEANKENILKALEWIADVSNQTSTVVIFYSGHGMEFPEYYLLPNNYDLSHLDETAISGKVFSEKLHKIQAKKLLVLLDCCHAGGQAQIKGAVASPLPEHVINEFEKHSGRVFLASSRKNEVSWTGQPLSVFTNAVVEAFKGHGAFEKDGFARVLDIAMWVARKVPERTEEKQHPILKVSNLEDNFTVAWYAAGKEQPYIDENNSSVLHIQQQTSSVQVTQNERESWKRTLENKRDNFLIIEERISSFVESRSIPLDLLRDRKETLAVIEDLEEKLENSQSVIQSESPYAAEAVSMKMPSSEVEVTDNALTQRAITPIQSSSSILSKGIKIAASVVVIVTASIIVNSMRSPELPPVAPPNRIEDLKLPKVPPLSKSSVSLFVSEHCHNMRSAILEVFNKEFTQQEQGGLVIIDAVNESRCQSPMLRGDKDLQINIECNQETNNVQASFCIGSIKYPPEIYEPEKIILNTKAFSNQVPVQLTRVLKALVHYVTFNFTQANQYLESAITNATDDQIKQTLLTYKANGSLFLSKYNDAEVTYKKALAYGKTAPLFNNLGVALNYQDWSETPEKEQQALDAFNAGMKNDPSYRLPQLSLVYLKLDDFASGYADSMSSEQKAPVIKQAEESCQQLQSLKYRGEALYKLCLVKLYSFIGKQGIEKSKSLIPQNDWKSMATPYWAEPLVVTANYNYYLWSRGYYDKDRVENELIEALQQSRDDILLVRGKRRYRNLLHALKDVLSGESTTIQLSSYEGVVDESRH